MNRIKNIIFDLGGIFIDINYQKTEDSFLKLGFKNFADFYKQDYVSDLFNDLEIGKINDNLFCNEIRKISKLNISNKQIIDAWNALLGTFFEGRINWLQQLNDYNIFLFSNTNKIHYDAFMRIYKKQFGNSNFDNFFIKAYYSHTLGLRKPNINSYEFILNEQNLTASETLFVDDTKKNIEGAAKAGLQTLLLLPNMSLQVEVEKLL